MLTFLRLVAPHKLSSRRRPIAPRRRGAFEDSQGRSRSDPLHVTPSPSFSVQEPPINPLLVVAGDLPRALPPRAAIRSHLRPIFPVRLSNTLLDLLLDGRCSDAQAGAFLIAHRLRRPEPQELAGLLDSQAEQIAAVYAPGCELRTVRTLDGWALLAGMRVR